MIMLRIGKFTVSKPSFDAALTSALVLKDLIYPSETPRHQSHGTSISFQESLGVFKRCLPCQRPSIDCDVLWDVYGKVIGKPCVSHLVKLTLTEEHTAFTLASDRHTPRFAPVFTNATHMRWSDHHYVPTRKRTVRSPRKPAE